MTNLRLSCSTVVPLLLPPRARPHRSAVTSDSEQQTIIRTVAKLNPALRSDIAATFHDAMIEDDHVWFNAQDLQVDDSDL